MQKVLDKLLRFAQLLLKTHGESALGKMKIHFKTPLDDLLDIATEDRVFSHQAKRVIDKFGGEANIARILSEHYGRTLHRSTVYRWTWPQSKGGTGGLIPTRNLRSLISIAREEGIFLTPQDLAIGRDD